MGGILLWRRGAVVATILTACVSVGCVGGPAFSARQGQLDLSGWSPSDDGPVRLEGDWSLYWEHLIDPAHPDDGEDPSTFARTSRPWNGLDVDGRRLGSLGFGTYRLQVKLPPDSPPLAVRVRDVSTAYRLYANGQLVASAGVLGTSRATSKPEYRPRLGRLPAHTGELDLVFQISNFRSARGGPWEALHLGTVDDVQRLRETALLFQIFLAGSMVIMGLYHLSLFAERRTDPSPFYFGAACVAMCVRVLTTEDRTIVELVPNLSWQWLARLEYLSMFPSAIFLAYFAVALFPRDVPRAPARGIVVVGIAFMVLVATTSNLVYARFLSAMQVYLAFTALFGATLVVRAAWRGRDGARLLAMAFVTLAVAVLHDIGVVARILDTPIYLAPPAIFFFVFLQAAILSRRFSRTLVTVEQMSGDLARAHDELETYSKGLEARVAERTEQLEQANQELARLATVDGLTGIGNRRYFEESLSRLWADHLRRESNIAVLLCDVDHFKRFNDSCGHLAGDDALRAVAGAFSESLRRPLDVLARYGGEEFVAVLADTGLDGARHVAEQLHASVAALEIDHPASDGPGGRLTISIGVASMVPGAAVPCTDLVAAADEALYRAKQAGRNRTVAADLAAPREDGPPEDVSRTP